MRPKWSSAVSSAPVRPGMSPISRKLNSIWGTLSLWHVLDAAHIKPCAKGGEHALTNGILLWQDLHTLLDLGNGKEYYAMYGSTLGLPQSLSFRPDPKLLQWHKKVFFLS
jgi:HNH endonuclease